jgi:hypothetical protein
MTLLSICQSAAGAAGFAVPSTIIGNTDATAVLLLRLLNKGGKNFARKPWQALQKEYTFSLVNGTASYAFPSDLGFFQNETAWDRTQFWQMRGSLSPEQWQIYKSGITSTTPRPRFRIKGGLIFFDPTPTSTDSIVIEYVSKNWVTDGSSFFNQFSADTQTSLIDEDLLELDLTWRFLERKGLAYAEAKDEADRRFENLLGRDVPKNSINVGMTGELVWPPLPQVPSTGYS